MQFRELTTQEFDQFSQSYDHTNFWQSINMAELREWNGWNTAYVGIEQDSRIIAATMLSYRTVFLGSTFVQAVRGFLIDYTNTALLDFFHEHLMQYLKGLQCMYFKLDPYLPRLERDEHGEPVEGGFQHEDVVAHLKAIGYQHMGYLRGNDDTREPNWMFVLDLKGKSEEQLLKEFDQQTRWSINKTKKLGIIIKEETGENLAIFKDIMEHTASRRGFEDHNLHYYEGLFQSFQKKGKMLALYAQLDVNDYEQRLEQEKETAIIELQAVEQSLLEVANSKKFNKRKKVLLEDISLLDKKLAEACELKQHSKEGMLTLAAATFILYGKEIMYLYSGAYDQYMRLNAPYALQWYIIRYALAHGYNRYNFYGISGLFERDADGYGIYEFKKGFTGTVEELVGDFYYYLQPAKYRLYQTLRAVKNTIRK